MKKLNLIFLLIIASVFVCCEKNSSKISELENLSGINFPEETDLLFYYDNLEFQVVFKMNIKRGSMGKFIQTNGFEKFNPKIKKEFKKVSKHNWMIEEMEKSFTINEKIERSEKTFLLRNNNIFLIADNESNIVWGVLEYGE